MLRIAPRTRLATLAITAVASVAAVPAAAQAAGPTGCPDVPMTHPFAPWDDHADYLLAPDGGLEEGGSAWVLAEGAAVQAGNESYNVRDAADAASLALPAGSSATTAAICIGAEHKSMRFFVKHADSSGEGSLTVEVLYPNGSGKLSSKRIGKVSAGETWQPSPVLPLIVNKLAGAHGNAMQVSLRFTPDGGGFSIDDVYVDPWRGN